MRPTSAIQRSCTQPNQRRARVTSLGAALRPPRWAGRNPGTMLTKGMISEIYQRQEAHERGALYAARQASLQIQPALDAANAGDLDAAKLHAERAAHFAQLARGALIAARDAAYTAALQVGATQPEAHSSALAATRETRHHSETAAEAWRAARRALTLGNHRAAIWSATYN